MSVVEEYQQREESSEGGSSLRSGEYTYDASGERVLVVNVLNERKEDALLLASTFVSLGFGVKIVSGIGNAADLFSLVEQESASSNGLFLCFILGDDAASNNKCGIVTLDGSCETREALVAAASVESMKGKPKIFFFDGRRIQTHDAGLETDNYQPVFRRVRLNHRGERILVGVSENSSSSAQEDETEIQDTLVVHSPRLVGEFDLFAGNQSLYLQVLCRELRKPGERREIYEILKHVFAKVQLITGEGMSAEYQN